MTKSDLLTLLESAVRSTSKTDLILKGFGIAALGAAAGTGLMLLGCSCTLGKPVTRMTPLTQEQLTQLQFSSLNCRRFCGDPPPANYGWQVDCAVSYDGDAGTARTLTCTWHDNPSKCISGRPPRGLLASRGSLSTSPLARHFANMAHLETASVVAFEDLGRWLEYYDAPKRLRARCASAANDERRHARLTRAEARRLGATIPRVRTKPVAVPTLTELAIDNAEHGMVGETWAAVELLYATEHTPSASYANMFRSIAEDETEHAALSFTLHEWLCTKINADDRHLVEEAQTQALDKLASSPPLAEELVAALGLPNANAAYQLRSTVRTLTL